jgi:hypothetical protein
VVVTERRVLRFFFKGKSYGSKGAAFRQLAKALLRAEILETIPRTDCSHCGGTGRYVPLFGREDTCYCDGGKAQPTDEEWKTAYGQRFPVEDCPNTEDEYGNCWQCCWNEADRWMCAHNYKEWINAKAKELMHSTASPPANAAELDVNAGSGSNGESLRVNHAEPTAQKEKK